MTDTHDGSHTWLKYLSRKKRQAEEEIEEFSLIEAEFIELEDEE